MDLLKRKKEKIQSKPTTKTIQIGLEDFPTKALDLTYNELMEQYKEQRTERLQKILVAISKELRLRADPDHEDETVKVEFENGNGETVNKKEQIKPLVKKKSILKSGGEIKENELNVKKSFSSFFKKKKKVVLMKPEKVMINNIEADQLVQTIDKIKEKQPEIFEKKQQKPKASLSTMFKSKPLFKKKPKTGFDIKGLGDIYCPDCKHHVDAHQSHGKSSGCKRCGCLRTVTYIAKASKKKVKKFKTPEKIDTRPIEIASEIQNLPNIQEDANEILEKERIQQAIEKHAQQLKSMQKDICSCNHTLKQHSIRDYHCRVKVCKCEEYNEK